LRGKDEGRRWLLRKEVLKGSITDEGRGMVKGEGGVTIKGGGQCGW
jgi:hypothetical protein